MNGRSGFEVTTIDDVARAAYVSIRTVSRVLNRSTKVNEDTRRRVEAAIAQLGFRPSLRARGLATGRSFMIGLVHNDRNALVLGEVQRGMVQEAALRGYELVVHPTPTEREEPLRNVLDFVRRSRVDGVLILPPVSEVVDLSHQLRQEGVPAIAVSAVELPGFASMFVSEERIAAATVARHLVDLGHRRIAIVSGPHNVISAQERRGGFVEALADIEPGLVGEAEGDYGFESGVAAALRLLALDPLPTAIFAANDIMAAGVLKAAASRGLSVPNALSVVGFDGSLLARVLTPSLTTVNRPLGSVAERATARLIGMIEGDGAEETIRVDLDLIVRESSGPARRM